MKVDADAAVNLWMRVLSKKFNNFAVNVIYVQKSCYYIELLFEPRENKWLLEALIWRANHVKRWRKENKIRKSLRGSSVKLIKLVKAKQTLRCQRNLEVSLRPHHGFASENRTSGTQETFSRFIQTHLHANLSMLSHLLNRFLVAICCRESQKASFTKWLP